MPSAAMIEDERLRLTLLSGQPTGVTSSTVGNLDVIIDRRPIGDDGKGMGFGEASEVSFFDVFFSYVMFFCIFLLKEAALSNYLIVFSEYLSLVIGDVFP